MRKARNIAFVVIAAVALLLPIANIAADKLVPGYEMKTQSYLEGRSRATFPDVSLKTVLGGEFQDGIEDYLGDSVPGRDTIMLANAAVQRAEIEVANLLFGFEAYPSFFGSKEACVPGYEVVVEMPVKASQKRAEELSTCAKAIGEAADAHPGVAWYFALVDRSSISLASPVHDMVAEPADTEFYRTWFNEGLPENVQTIDLSENDATAFFEDYYSTDHHWRTLAAAQACSSIMEVMGREAPDLSVMKAYAGPFYGANARTGLVTSYWDSVDDVEYERSSLTVRVNGKEKPESFLDASYAEDYTGYTKSGKFMNVYADYFHTDFAQIEIENASLESDEVLLIIGDSFTNPIERLFAEDFRKVYVVDPRYFKRDGVKSWDIDSFIEDNGVTSVLFLCSGNNITASNYKTLGILD